MDFRNLATSATAQVLTSPRDIFAALPQKPSGFGYLRDVQGQVLDAWMPRRTDRDVVIKMNTGAGKTLVGLLILQASINEGITPALYVAPSSYLVRQAIRQAAGLGIRTTEDPESTDYVSGRAIGIVNVHKVVNGLSVFGGPGSTRVAGVAIGAVVIDDAHAALGIVEDQATVKLPSSHAAYTALLTQFQSDLRSQSETTLADLKEQDPTAVLRVPFWAWGDRSAETYSVLRPYLADDVVKFSLPLVKESLAYSAGLFTSSALEIRPPFPPVSRIQEFARARRRVFLSATLSDDTALVAAFDADPDAVLRAVTPNTASDLGDRLILAPQEINPDISDEDLRQSAQRLSQKYNVVVLVPSFRRADAWANVADQTAAGDDVDGAVAALRTGHVGLVVLVNKYDGIDLPDEACRVLVLDGVPETYSGLERREAVALGEADALVSRQLQRIEQGMGRGVRSNEDYCAVWLIGRRLTQRIADPRLAAHLSPATRAQLDLSRQVAARLINKPLAEIVAVVEQVLARDVDWVTASRAVLATTSYPPGHVDLGTAAARRAFNAAEAGQFARAVTEMRASVEAATDPRLKGWRLEQQAVYEDRLDHVKAQEVLTAAIDANPRVTRPRAGVSIRRMSAPRAQAETVSRALAATYSNGNELLVGVEAILDGLVFDPAATDDFEASMDELGTLLGFNSSRPERDTGNGPDVMWATASQTYAVIECKSGSTATEIARKDLAQLAHSMNWFRQTYGNAPQANPVLVHPSSTSRPNAAASADDVVITRVGLANLVDAARRTFVALAANASWTDEGAVRRQLEDNQLTSGTWLAAFGTRPTQSR